LSTTYSVAQLQEDVDFTYKKLQKLQPKLYQYIPKKDLDFKFDSLKKSLNKPLNAKAFYSLLTPIVSEVRQAHISNGFPDRRYTKKERKALKKTKLDFFELDMKYIEDGLYISRTGPKDSVLIGSQLVAVGMETTAALLKKFKKTIPPEGYNQTLRNNFIANNFTGIYRKHYGFRDSISLILMQNDSVFVKQFKRYLKGKPPGKSNQKDSTFVAPKKNLSKAEKKTNKVARKQKRKRDKKYGYLGNRKLFTRNFRFLDSMGRIGYIKIRSWNNGPHKAFFNESFSKLDSAKTKHLIIDIRDNPGGNLDQIHDFYRYLSTTNFKFINAAEVKTRLPNIKNFYGRNSSLLSVLRQTAILPYLLANNLTKTRKTAGQLQYHFKESKSTKPEALHFKGKIYVLINGGSFSASVAGHFKIITLPHSKLAFQLGLMQLETPHRQEPDGFGIKPDIPIKPTLTDFLANRDTALEHLLEIIQHD